MNVKLISHSTPAEDFKAEGVDNVQELIAFCARVSNPSNQINSETSEKLIRYLIKHYHWSPLEMVSGGNRRPCVASDGSVWQLVALGRGWLWLVGCWLVVGCCWLLWVGVGCC